ncbi:Uncharacterised protein [Enterobacter hormaechei]|nr:Uncharacterised protein [Enterobacter hormaechei]
MGLVCGGRELADVVSLLLHLCPGTSAPAFTTTGIALPRQGNVPGLTGMPSHTQSDFRCADTKKPRAINPGRFLLRNLFTAGSFAVTTEHTSKYTLPFRQIKLFEKYFSFRQQLEKSHSLFLASLHRKLLPQRLFHTRQPVGGKPGYLRQLRVASSWRYLACSCVRSIV